MLNNGVYVRRYRAVHVQGLFFYLYVERFSGNFISVSDKTLYIICETIVWQYFIDESVNERYDLSFNDIGI